MTDTTVKKVSSGASPVGPDGQVYLVSGKRMAMRLCPRVDTSTRSSASFSQAERNSL